MYYLVAYVDAIVPIYLSYFIQSHNVRTVYTHKTVGWQQFFCRLHGHVRNQSAVGKVENNIIFHSFHIHDIAQRHLLQFAVYLQKHRCALVADGLRRHLEPLFRLFGSSKKLVVAYRLQQKVERIHLVAVESILFERRRKDDAGMGRHHVRKLHTVHIGHLNIEKQHVGTVVPYGLQRSNRVGKRCFERQKRRALYKLLQ